MLENSLLHDQLKQIVSLLSRMVPPSPHPIEAKDADCFVWNSQILRACPVKKVCTPNLVLFAGIDHIRDIFVENTLRFANGFAANNVLLWGARGMGKSSLVKATHNFVNQQLCKKKSLKLVEIYREDINTLPTLLNEMAKSPWRFLLFCDDLSFDYTDASYKFLKTALDGGVKGCPENILFYATSNRRHLVSRNMIENEYNDSIHCSEAIEEKVSLSDRFGLWLGFHGCDQEVYLQIIENYIKFYNLEEKPGIWRRQALEWALTRGSRSGRVAWQFVQDLAGRLGKALHH